MEAPAPKLTNTLASIHWVGKKQLAGETNAAVLMDVWGLPQSLKLEQQTLYKLSLAPSRLSRLDTGTNVALLLQPLVQDVLQEESYLEVRAVTHEPGQLAFAIRLDDARAGLWETNLAAALESLTGIRPVSDPARHGWSLQKHHAPDLLELTRAGGWTIFGAASNHNALLEDMLARIGQNQLPFPAVITNHWLTVAVDLGNLDRAFSLGLNLPKDFPRIEAEWDGDGKDLWTYGTLTFPHPLAMDLDAWNIPTNLMDQPLTSFVAVRGIQPWLAGLKTWNDLQTGPPPNQFYSWSVQGNLPLTYFTAPLNDAGNTVSRLTDLVLQKSASWFASNDLARFERSHSFNGVEWKGVPYLCPFLKSVTNNSEPSLFGGFVSVAPTQPPPADLFRDLLVETNLIVHDWEQTGTRIEDWIYAGQFARLVVLQKSQLPPQSVSLLWLRAIQPKVGTTVTQVFKKGPSQLWFHRKSTIGFTGIELQLLADWLESPGFPIGLHTTLAPPQLE